MSFMQTAFSKRLKEKQCVFGPFMKAQDPAFVEIAGHAGFEFVIFDMEHGPVDVLHLQNLIRGAESAGVTPIVRVSALDPTSISRVLDVGARGVQVPMIESAKEAELAIQYAKYAPEGMRGVCKYVRASAYSKQEAAEYFQAANRDTLVILQMEGVKALENIDSILEVKGTDIVFIGPYDLSQSLGVPGQVEHPLVEEKMRIIVEKAREKGIVIGTFVDNVKQAQKWMDAGVQYISYSVDVGIFYQACRQIRNQLEA